MRILGYSSISFFIVIYICMLNTITANATNPKEFTPYKFAGVKAGIVQPTPLYGNTGLDTGEPTSAAGALIGIKFHKMLSVDLEYMHRGKNTTQDSSPGETDNPTSWSTESDTLMLNLSVDIMTDSRATPYLRGGVGMAYNQSYTYTIYDTETESNSYYPGETTNNFTWNAGFGVNFKATPIIITELEYMFVNRGEIKTQPYYLDDNGVKYNLSPIHAHLADHVLTFGLKMKF